MVVSQRGLNKLLELKCFACDQGGKNNNNDVFPLTSFTSYLKMLVLPLIPLKIVFSALYILIYFPGLIYCLFGE